MKKIYTFFVFFSLLIFIQISFALDTNAPKTTDELIKITAIDEQKIRQNIPAWDELKNREYSLVEFGLLENDKSYLFIKVFMAKIKYIKRHINDDGFVVKNNIPLNAQTKKVDEKQMLENIKNETFQLLGFSPSEIFDPNGKTSYFFNK